MICTLPLWLLREPICTIAGTALVEDDGAVKADAIVVLGGDAFGTRIVRAAELEKAGYASRILVSGPVNLLGRDSDETIVYASRKGYPATMFEAVPLPESAGSTESESQYLGSFLQQQGINSIDLVTSNYHTRRAARLWRKANPWLKINVVPAPDKYFTAEAWYKSREGQKTFLLEWTKTITGRFGI